MFDWITPVGNFVGIVVVLTSGVWWLQSQFSNQKSYFFTQIEKLMKTILDKLEYHERHDDARFAEIRNDLAKRIADIKNDIWEIRLRNAVIDGKSYTKTKERIREEVVDQDEKTDSSV